MVIGLSGTHELPARQHLENYGIDELQAKNVTRDDHGPTAKCQFSQVCDLRQQHEMSSRMDRCLSVTQGGFVLKI